MPTHHAGLPVFGPRQVASVTGRGKTFMGYLVNTARQYERCVACGVTTVLTDRPDVICLLARLTGPETHGGDQRMADG